MGLLFFGVAKDIAGAAKIDFPETVTRVAELKQWLYERYPAIQQLNSLMIAVNREYAADEQIIHLEDEVAVIPPVSGG
ncbi:molybdopterin converting factor subunit 1 [Chitinophaga qingshengii]|uniref:Molybdopterin synthase sulfur carrier subunit n=1 Tax=Chitinophaga qingshengii TaxID=1569794 RepID=A0ABR7TP00_9BACT|nr:molybdopterin converting factor subunit 1 [Chitinophaga qingshengii]MBC9931154.1 molybdopterin converting factor subunit 1 [Chitinophaga qingshengii]